MYVVCAMPVLRNLVDVRPCSHEKSKHPGCRRCMYQKYQLKHTIIIHCRPMRGFRRNSSYYSCNNCANYLSCNSWLYYSVASTDNRWNINIDCYSGRGSMVVCKIPFTLAWNFILLQYIMFSIDLIVTDMHID